MLKYKLKHMFCHMEEKCFNFVKYLNELRNIRKKKNLYSSVKITSVQKKELKEYFKKNYGRNYSDKWHRLYTSYTGTFDINYFPEILYITKLERKLNDYAIGKQICDKSFIDLLFGDIQELKLPKTFLINCSGIYYNSKREIINEKTAFNNVKNIGKCLIKPTLDSNSGRNVRICNFENGIDTISGNELETILKKYSKNYILQEVVKNCKELLKLHPASLNTIRLITYIVDGKLYHCPMVLKIGRKGNYVDNAHAGGIGVGIDEDGLLRKEAFSEYGERFERHPESKVSFENYKIPNIRKLISVAYKCHAKMPHMNILSWDLTIDENNNVCLIEVNTLGQSVWFPQYCNGESLFGENTEYMYNLIKK